jgi:hypothetical protein
MDDIVKQAMAKWPNVPHVYGWLSLDRRGVWRIKNETISSELISGFIGRNYACDNNGRWFFQNGPQRVFVALEYTPFVYRCLWDANPDAALCLETHTGTTVREIASAWLDDSGVLLLQTERGIGMVDDRDLERLLPHLTDSAGNVLDEDMLGMRLEQLQAGAAVDLCLNYGAARIALNPIAASRVAAKFSFVPQPAPAAGEDACT